MKYMKIYNRILAGLMAAAMVFLSVDAGCLNALAAELQNQSDEQKIEIELPTGYIKMDGIAIDIVDYDGEIYDYRELENVSVYSEVYINEWNKYSTNYFYNQLSDEWKAVWRATDILCMNFLTQDVDATPFSLGGYYLEMIWLPEYTLMEDGEMFMNLFMASNPQYYFLENSMLYSKSEDDVYMLGFCLGVYDGFADGEIRAVETAKFKTAIDTALNGQHIGVNASEIDKLKYVHDYVVNKTDYNYDILSGDSMITNEEEETAYTQSAYSTFCMETTVCAGYAEAVQLLANGLGIDAIVVTSADHMWNKVRVNDTWYNVDATWADNGKTDGVNNPIYYGYYGRSDAFYAQDTSGNASSHVVEDIWSGYLPVCEKDSNPQSNYTPGNFHIPNATVATPVIKLETENASEYTVTLSVDGNATIYYTLDGTTPSIAASRSYIYEESFTVEKDTVIKAIAVLDGYYDSEVAERTAIISIGNPTIRSHFYKELTFTWDALGEMVDGYIINVYNGTTNEKIGQSIEITDGFVDFYAYDTKELTDVSSIYFEIAGYVLGENQDKVVVTNMVKTTKMDINVLTSPLNVKVKWHVTTTSGIDYLVINVEEIPLDGADTQEQLCLWYYTDENGVDLVKNFTLYTVNGVTEFKYALADHGIAYDEVGYVYITNGSKTSAFQREGFAVGGTYKEPVLESIPDVNLESSGQTVELEAVMKEDTLMENFNYKYQWYVADEPTAQGTKIDGATNVVYTVEIGSFDVKYYYCEVITEYLEIATYTTNNGTQSEDFQYNHTRVEGALYETEIRYEPIANRVFTGEAITVDDLVLRNDLDEVLVLGTDYDVDYENNTNAGNATIIVRFKGNYANLDDARILFTIEPKTVSKDETKYIFTDVSAGQTFVYNGMEHTPEMTITDVVRNYNLRENVDYKIEYRGNVDAGNATIVLKFINNYVGETEEMEILFRISQRTTDNVVIAPLSSYTYTGKEIVPELDIQDTSISRRLELNKDYKIVCVNNIAVGGATVTVEFIKNYTGESRTVTFNITQKNAADSDVRISSVAEQEYTGDEIKPGFDVTYNGMFLTEGTDYRVSYSENIELGQATIILEFRRNYYGTRTINFEIVPRKAENLSYSDITEEYTYNGKAHKPEEIVIQNGEIELVEGVDYQLSYGENINAGKGTVIVAFDGFDGDSAYYTGEKTIEFEIGRKNIMDNLEDIEVTVDTQTRYVYDGTAITPAVTVVDKGILVPTDEPEVMEYTDLAVDVDFEVEYENNINAGEATVIVNFVGNYEGQMSSVFTIERKPITRDQIQVEQVAPQTYTGKVIIPEVVVRDMEGVALTKDLDYEVSAASENIYVGVGTIKISLEFEGNYIYEGSPILVDFEIVPKDAANVRVEPIPNQTYTGSPITPDLRITDGDILLIPGTDYTVVYSDNTEVGVATVVITFTGNFTGVQKTVNFTIIDPIPEEITSSVFAIDQTRNYISKVSVGTTAHTLLSGLNEQEYVSICDKTGTGLSGATTLGTGMLARIMDGSKVERTYTIIITGDTNGDGKINITDMIAVKACTLKKSDLTGVYEKAGDVNGDGKINITDFIKVKATTLKKDTITGVEVK